MFIKINKKLVDAVVKSYDTNVVLNSDMYAAAFSALEEYVSESEEHMTSLKIAYWSLVEGYCKSRISVLLGVPCYTLYPAVSSIREVVRKAIASVVSEGTMTENVIRCQSVNVLRLSNRTLNVLLRGGIETIGELYNIIIAEGRGDWGKRYRNCGKKTMLEVEEALFREFPMLDSKGDVTAMSVSRALADIEERVDNSDDLETLHEILSDLMSVCIPLTCIKNNMSIEREAIHHVIDYYRENAFKSTEEDNLAALEVFSNI